MAADLLNDLARALVDSDVLDRDVMEAEPMPERGEIGLLLSDGGTIVLRVVHADVEGLS